jgi:hypothetical protein
MRETEEIVEFCFFTPFQKNYPGAPSSRTGVSATYALYMPIPL